MANCTEAERKLLDIVLNKGNEGYKEARRAAGLEKFERENPGLLAEYRQAKEAYYFALNRRDRLAEMINSKVDSYDYDLITGWE